MWPWASVEKDAGNVHALMFTSILSALELMDVENADNSGYIKTELISVSEV